ncbi:MAG: hypothetical protein II111_00955 [Oscillospiraceae bacterium]|nr:hypothetical protein [Oscillospiraceae bacterium]
MMRFLSRFRDAMIRFMYGRNGVDQLVWATIIAEIALSLISAFVRNTVVYRVLHVVSLVLLVLAIYRMLSRDLPRRRAENEKFLRWWGPRRDAITGARARRADKAHKYVRCSCGATCRVPRGVGKIELTCPKCGKKKIVKT